MGGWLILVVMAIALTTASHPRGLRPTRMARALLKLEYAIALIVVTPFLAIVCENPS